MPGQPLQADLWKSDLIEAKADTQAIRDIPRQSISRRIRLAPGKTTPSRSSTIPFFAADLPSMSALAILCSLRLAQRITGVYGGG
jgi:hypothetical protein